MQQHEKFEEEPERNIIQLTAGYPVWILITEMFNKSGLQKSPVISNGSPTSHLFHGLTLKLQIWKAYSKSRRPNPSPQLLMSPLPLISDRGSEKGCKKDRMIEQPLVASAIFSQRNPNQDVCKFSETTHTANPGINPVSTTCIHNKCGNHLGGQ